MTSARTSELPFIGTSAAVFLASVSTTIAWCASMSSMSEMPMVGGWALSMVWMRMPGQTWLGAGAAFVGMWITMMAAMMLPSLVGALRRYRQAIGPVDPVRLNRATAIAGSGYFAVWAGLGVATFIIGVALAAVAMRQPIVSRAVPAMAGVVVLLAGVLQFTSWKARRLDGCRQVHAPPSDAWTYGVRLGLHCARCCVSPMAILLVFGVMDLRAMAVVTAAITAERVSPFGVHAARVTGFVAIGAASLLIARAVGAL